MPEINPRQIAFARTRRCYKKERLAEALGVSIQTLQSYEAGTSAPDDAMLSRIALLLNFPRSFFFLEEDMPVISEHAASFRALSKMSAGTRACALGAGAIAFRLNEWMDARFKLPQADLPDLSDLSPEDAALTLRMQWGLGYGPIRNMIHLLESKGVRVFSLTEESRDVDAFCSWYEGTPFVFLNTMKSAERSRFDAAHELGHLVRDTYSMLHRNEMGGSRHHEIEQKANAFAEAFLMPKDAVIARKPSAFTLLQLIKIKRYWGVPLGAGPALQRPRPGLGVDLPRPLHLHLQKRLPLHRARSHGARNLAAAVQGHGASAGPEHRSQPDCTGPVRQR